MLLTAFHFGAAAPSSSEGLQFKAMLGVPPVDGPVMAVRVSILADLEKAKN